MALSVPSLPPEILNTTWRTSRKADKPKINAAVNSIKCTIASMCGIHIHTMSGMKKADIEIECESKYHAIVAALRLKYPDAVALHFIAHTNNKLIKLLDGNGIYRLSQRVRKTCVNSYNGHWLGSLDSGIPPSGRSWNWVRMRVLVLLHRELKKNTSTLPANQGKTNTCLCY